MTPPHPILPRQKPARKVNFHDKFALDLAVELAMDQQGLPRNSPSLKAAVKKKVLAAMQTRPLLRRRYGAGDDPKKQPELNLKEAQAT